MDGHVNSTLDPGDGSNWFDMQMTNIPFAYYEVIFYIGANDAQYGDGTGKIVFNGGAERAFKLKSGAFDGNFIEMVNGTTVGNYIVYQGVTRSSITGTNITLLVPPAQPVTTLAPTFTFSPLAAPATEVYLKIYRTDSGSDVIYATHRQTLVSTAYDFAVPIAAGKFTYKVTYGTRSGGIDSAPLATVSNLLCGDAFIIEGQSNAIATDNTAPNDLTTDPWIRTYGLTTGWGGAYSKGGERQLGLWGWYLAKRLTLYNNMPVCIINGAVGGTRIDQHMPNPTNHALPKGSDSIYANLYNPEHAGHRAGVELPLRACGLPDLLRLDRPAGRTGCLWHLPSLGFLGSQFEKGIFHHCSAQ